MLIDDLLKDYDEYDSEVDYVDELKKSIASLVLTTSLVVNTKRNVSEMRQKVIDDFKYMVSAIRVSDMMFPNDKLFEFCEEKVLAQQNARLSLVFVKETYEEKGEVKFALSKIVHNRHNINAKMNLRGIEKIEYQTGNTNNATVLNLITENDSEYLAIIKDTYLENQVIVPQTAAVIKPTGKDNASIVPTPDATDFPPVKPKNKERL